MQDAPWTLGTLLNKGQHQRWVVLLAMSGMLWGNYFVFDIPANLSTHLKDHMSLGDIEYSYTLSMLYSAYSIPNIVLPFVGGFICEKYGTERTLVWTLLFQIAGHFTFVLGTQLRWVLPLIAGRVLLGIGSEIMWIIATGVVSAWFQNKELSIALAVTICGGRLGSVAGVLLVPQSIESRGIVATTWLSLLVLVPCVCGAVAILFIGTTPIVRKAPITRNLSKQIDYCRSSLGKLSGSYWVLAVNSMAFYSVMTPFGNSALRFLTTYGMDLTHAGSAYSITSFMSGSLVLPFGLLLQKTANHSIALLAALAILFASHILFLYTIGPYLPLVMLGLSYGIYGAAIMPYTTRLISGEADIGVSPGYVGLPGDDIELDVLPRETDGADEDLVIIGYGIWSSLINLCLTIVPLFLALFESWRGYFGIELLFVLLAIIGMVSAWKLPNVLM